MKNSLRIMAVAVIFWFGLGSANAIDKIAPVTVNPLTQGDSFFHTPGSFVDNFQFDIGPFGNFFSSAVTIPLPSPGVPFFFDITPFTLQLFAGFNGDTSTPIGAPSSQITSGSSFGLADILSPGTYHLQMTGSATGFGGGAYLVTVAALPVPEPETYAMLLVGLGLVGFTMRRRKTGSSGASFA